ncbi:hypothetical protein OAK52_01570 [Chloroflexi bacterium]|nr:hypothetical protein [Chloroflexota bacterium]
MAIITLIIQNNFYTNSSSIINETTNSDIEKVSKKPVQSNIPNKDENPVSIENGKIIDEKIDSKTKDQKNEITEVKKIEKSDEGLEKILKEKADKVIENSKSNKPLEKEIPDYIAIILAKIISDEKIDSKNIQLDSYEKTTWNSSSLGCPKNDMSYAQVMTDGYKLLFLSNNKMTEYRTDLRENYINCTEIRESNFDSNYNFFEIYELENIKKIQLNLNKDDKIISIIDDEIRINNIIDSINKNITITQADDCDPSYKLIFEKQSSSTEILVYCSQNPYYVYVDESINAGNTILSIVEEMLSTMEFPGMPQ